MQRVNCYSFYQLGTVLHPLADIKAGVKVKDVLMPLWIARAWLTYFLQDQLVPVTICKTKGSEILASINHVIPVDLSAMSPESGEAELAYPDLYTITNGVKEFEVLLNAELPGLDVYSVSSKGIYSTPLLIDHADDAFPEDIKQSLSKEIRDDVCQAGRCLAFDLPTAAGFHILRAMESVLREYYRLIVGKFPRARNWGAYIEHLKKHKANPKTVAILDQIRELHRNPTMHPEVVLSMTEATILFDIAKSAMVTMAEEMQKKKPAQVSPPASP
jgi:hypothetical protein